MVRDSRRRIDTLLQEVEIDRAAIPDLSKNMIHGQRRKTMSVTDQKFNPSGNPLIGEIKAAANALAEVIERLPRGRRRSVALTHLETASMWAVKAAAAGDE